MTFSFSRGGQRRPWGGARPSGGTCSVSAWGGRRRPAGPSGPKGRVGRLVAGPIDRKLKKIISE
jgi:hypothetical protein